ncbi:hypothetical protein GCM10011519_08710 [Marmoricola endophyticus]|uniref:Secreted protein n=1 Tax=Marmoricola endophyticus TaxID=2040280 RepID=A0A917BG13_9ACTN|nr:hypothetical protein [Marmoricola endophyticus]GGF37431.1 hypothetical protein GCM10011519_08710 [Marmoricola endophyticus]
MALPARRTRQAAVAAAALAAAAVPATALSAHAATPAAAPPLNVDYDAVGTSHVAKTDSDVAIGPTTLSTTVQAAGGALTGHLPIPQTSTSFKAVGFLPISAKVDFVEAAPITGTLGRDGTRTVVKSTASYYLKLTDVKAAGLPAFVGDTCQTKEPISVPADTPDGESFNIVSGGHLTGTFDIGSFEHCGLTTPLINLLVPGSGNTLDLTVSNGRIKQ